MKESLALTRTDYLRSRVLSNLSVLMIAYPLALCVLFFLSLWLSKLAARPMEQAVEMERQFVADISHDLKTPITVVLANDAILRSNPDLTAGEQMQWIDASDAAARNMMDMVEQMLTLSSLESVNQTVEKTEVNLSACAEKSVLQLDSVAYERGITVESDVAPDIRISATEEHCMRILSGLIENAICPTFSSASTGATRQDPAAGATAWACPSSRGSAICWTRRSGSAAAKRRAPFSPCFSRRCSVFSAPMLY